LSCPSKLAIVSSAVMSTVYQKRRNLNTIGNPFSEREMVSGLLGLCSGHNVTGSQTVSKRGRGKDIIYAEGWMIHVKDIAGCPRMQCATIVNTLGFQEERDNLAGSRKSRRLLLPFA
jgi:hypothetical protein